MKDEEREGEKREGKLERDKGRECQKERKRKKEGGSA